MNTIVQMGPEKISLLHEVVAGFRGVPRVAAIVLGGSQASGLARPDSDLDIGLYYHAASPFSVSDVRAVAERIARGGSVPLVTGPYEWGPWVNGGAWIETPMGQVDFVYRNLDQVGTVIDEGRRGIWRHDYDQQPPYGFRSVVYFGEIHICVPLDDPQHEITRLKQLVAEYPPALQDRIVQDSLWGAEFSLLSGHNFGGQNDVYSVAGCMTRAAQFLIQALFALNKEYFLSDKGVNRRIDGFSRRPRDFTSRLAALLAAPGSNSIELDRSVELLRALWQETVDLTAGTYNPRWSAARDKLAP